MTYECLEYNQVFSNKDGSAHAMWKHIGVPFTIIEAKDHCGSSVDWLK